MNEYSLEMKNICKRFLSLKALDDADFYLKKNRKPYAPGEIFRQPVLAQTLEILSQKGIEEFYLGGMARQIADDMAANDGFIQADDLSDLLDGLLLCRKIY